jgi:hypothetical protein
MREGDRPALLARLRVGTKLMLLALLPVGVLVIVAVVAVIDAWRAADNLRDFQAATQQSFAAGDLARALSDERAATVLARLRPGSAADAAARPRPPFPSMSPDVWRRSEGSCRCRGSRPPPGRPATRRSQTATG